MSQKMSPGAWCVIMAIFRRGVEAACGAAAPAAAGAWVGCDGAPPALQAMATEASPPAHAKNIVRLMPTPSRGLLIVRVSLSRAGSQVSGYRSACQYIFSSFRRNEQPAGAPRGLAACMHQAGNQPPLCDAPHDRASRRVVVRPPVRPPGARVDTCHSSPGVRRARACSRLSMSLYLYGRWYAGAARARTPGLLWQVSTRAPGGLTGGLTTT